MLRPREVTQQADVRNCLKEQEFAATELLSHELHSAVFSSLARKEKGDEAVVESPVAFEVTAFNKFDSTKQMLG